MSVFTRRKARHTPAAVRAARTAAGIAEPAGRHAQDEQQPADYDTSYDDPGWGGEPHDATSPGLPLAAPAATAPAGDDTMVWRVPGTGDDPGYTVPPGAPWASPEDALPLRTPGAAIPAAQVPQLRTEPADPALLREVAAALRALPDPAPERPRPVAWLRALEHDGQQAAEALAGVPSFAGVDRLPDGTLVAGMFLGLHAGGTWLVDAVNPAWCEDAITALTAMRDRLVAARRQIAAPQVAREPEPAIPAVPAAGGAQ